MGWFRRTRGSSEDQAPDGGDVARRPPTDSPPARFADAVALLRLQPVGPIPLADRRRLGQLHGDLGAADAVIPITADYHVGAILDLPDVDVPVSGTRVELWGTTIGEVLAAAYDNAGLERVRLFEHDGAVVLESRAMAASLLLSGPGHVIPGTHPELARWGELTPVILIVDDATCLVGYAEDPSSIESVARVAEEALSTTMRPVSVTPLMAQGDRWVPYSWPAHAASAVHQLHRRWDFVRYERSRDAIVKWMEDRGEFPVVQRLKVGAGNDDGVYRSHVPWVEGIDNLLPITDDVVLVTNKGVRTMVPFSVLEDRGLLPPYPGLYPEYRLGSDFPADLV
jgi:hypothetical protein